MSTFTTSTEITNMNDMLTVLKALAPNTATITAHEDFKLIQVRDTWPVTDPSRITGEWPGECSIGFSQQPNGQWMPFLVLDSGLGAAPRRKLTFAPADVLRLTRFFADPLHYFLRGTKKS